MATSSKKTVTKATTKVVAAPVEEKTEVVAAPTEEKVVAQVEPKPVLTRYKFIATCNNLNVSNVIFNNIKVVICEVDATNYDAAFDKFQAAVMKMFNGDVSKYNTFMNAVFGKDILVEATKVDQIKEDIAILH